MFDMGLRFLVIQIMVTNVAWLHILSACECPWYSLVNPVGVCSVIIYGLDNCSLVRATQYPLDSQIPVTWENTCNCKTKAAKSSYLVMGSHNEEIWDYAEDRGVSNMRLQKYHRPRFHKEKLHL